MMKLNTAGPSPFGRKIKIALHVLSLKDTVELVMVDTADPSSENRRQNPLGKIPTLVTDEGAIYDSRVILDYLNELSEGHKLWPASGAGRHQTLTRAALMDGAMDAAILIVYEARMRPADMRVESFVSYQRDKIIRALEYIKAHLEDYQNGAQPDAADIGLACLIDYLDFRQQLNWRDYAPSLEGWMMKFAADVPGYHDTLPEGVSPASFRTRQPSA